MHCSRDGREPHPLPQTQTPASRRRTRGRRRTRKRSVGGGATSGLLQVAVLLAGAGAGNPPLAHGGLTSGTGAAGGAPLGVGGSVGCCHRRGLAEYSTRGCFVLCVTPSTATAGAQAGTGGRHQRRGGVGVVAGTSTVRRTRAGAVASQPLLAGAFLNRRSLEDRVAVAAAGGDGGCGAVGLSRGGGAGGDLAAGTGVAGGARGLECAAKNGGKGGRTRSRLRKILHKIRGGRATPPPVTVAAAATGNEMMYDTSQRQEELVDLADLKAGNTFEADANCPTCRAQVPYVNANVVSKLLFAWVGGLMARGNQKALAEEDLWDMPEDQRMKPVSDEFEAAYARESTADAAQMAAQAAYAAAGGEGTIKARAPGGAWIWRRKHPLVPGLLDTAVIRSLYYLYRGPFLTAGALRFVNTVVQFLPAILVQRLLRLLESGIAAGGAGAVKKAYILCAMLFTVVSLKTAIENQYFYTTNNIGTSTRGVLSTAVYRKSLRLSPSARQNATVGEIVNYMQIDAGRLETIALSVHTIWDSMFQMMGYTTLLVLCLGPSALAGIAVMTLLIPLNAALFNDLSKYREEMAKKTDQRVKLVNEMLQGIRAIKFYNWETPFKERVERIHDDELGIFRKAVTVRSLVVSVLSTTPAIVIAVTLEQDAVHPGRTRHTVTPALHGCTLEVKKGELVAIVGAVGSGKSSLLAALLGDLKHVSGDIYAAGALAYVPQTAWIPNDTVRNNVLFGKPYDEAKYEEVLTVCRLRRDLELLENGDMTEIGEQGINLSGGQKQRLSLARALYSDADLFLLDDPLSALDAEVGKQVFEGCVRDALGGKTRLLVTNQLQFLPQVDKIVVMGQLPGAEGATIVDQGTYDELVGRGRDFSNILEEQKAKGKAKPAEAEHMASATAAVEIDDVPPMTSFTDVATTTTTTHSASPSASASVATAAGDLEHERGHAHEARQQHEQGSPDGGGDQQMAAAAAAAAATAAAPRVEGSSGVEAVPEDTDMFSHVTLGEGECGPVDIQQETQGEDTANVNRGGLMTSEERSTGAVDRKVYFEYMKAMGPKVVLLSLVALFIVSNFTVQIQQWVVSFWTSDPTYARHSLRFYLAGVTASAAVVGIFSHLRTMWALYLGLGASKRLHAALLRRVLHAPVSFFDTTPVGRTIQRFSKDTDQTLGGLSAIRAFGHVNLFARTNERLVDNNFASQFALKTVDRWLSVRLEMMGNVVVLMATLLSVYAASNGKLVAGLAGLSITNALSVTGLLNWAVRCVSETEMVMNSVERVLYTSQQTPQEPPHHVSRPRHPYYHQLSGLTGENLPAVPSEDKQLTSCPDDRQLLTTGWPWEGRIEFRDGVTMRYRPDTELVLKGVSLAIRPGEKIGIVGRTGSGKSTLMQVLFRMVDCEGGSVAIDGVDTKAIGLAALRSRLTIIPQEPVLFSGSLRANLDPFEVYTDEEVWDALEQASLAPTVRRFPKGLLEPVAEYGESLSAGQRQLVCLARALLRKTRVLLLDEATSSVDYETDNVIQSTLRSAFRDCTVLTIAHRLNTIMDSDRILVMEDGKVAELDSPAALLEDPSSEFSQLLASERRQSPAASPSTDADVQGEAGGHDLDLDHDHDHGAFDKVMGVVGGAEGAEGAEEAAAAAAAAAPPPPQ
eukprot:g1282.t1